MRQNDFIFQAIYDLLTCCKSLNKVSFLMPAGFSRAALQSRYLATIEAIDPAFVDFVICQPIQNEAPNESEDSD
jgi:hypothetical protein